MVKKLFTYGLIVSALGALTGCAHHNITPLKHVKKDNADFIEQKEGIQIRINRITQENEHECFGRGRHIPFKRLVPLKLTIKNKSPYTVYLSTKHISLALAQEQEVVQALKSSAWTPFLTGLGAATVGGVIAGAVADNALQTATDVAGTSALIAGTGASVTAAQKNDEMAIDIHGKILHSIELWPGEKITKLLFAYKQEFKKHFTINACLLTTNEDGKSTGKKLISFKVKL